MSALFCALNGLCSTNRQGWSSGGSKVLKNWIPKTTEKFSRGLRTLQNGKCGGNDDVLFLFVDCLLDQATVLSCSLLGIAVPVSYTHLTLPTSDLV